MIDSIVFTVPGKPQGKGRPRVTRNGTYTPESTRRYEKAVREAYKAAGGEMFPPGALAVYIYARFPIPKSWTKKRKLETVGEYHTKKPDADNIAKIVQDALNGVAYEDDSCIAELTVRKLYDERMETDGFIDVFIKAIEVSNEALNDGYSPDIVAVDECEKGESNEN